MIFTQGVTAWAETTPQTNFRITSVKIDRNTGLSIGKATIKGISSDVSELRLGMLIDVYIATESSDAPWEDDLESTSKVFSGIAHSAKQNEEGIVTIEAYEVSERLQNSRVKLEVEEPTYTDEVIIEFLEEIFGNVTRNLSNADKFRPYVAEQQEFDQLSEVTERPWRFGSAKRGEYLIDAIQQILNALGGVLWVDKTGILRVEPYPNHDEWKVPFITKLNSGEETRSAERVIFQGNAISSELGQAAAYTHNLTAPESAASIAGSGEEPPAPERTLQDENVNTQGEADQQAFNNAVNQDQRRNYGKITIIGNSSIDLFDHVIVPELEYTVEDPMVSSTVQNNLQQGKYKVDGLVHKVNSQDGFLTEIKLSRPIEATYSDCTVDADEAFSRSYLSRYENSIEKTRVSGQSDASGFVSNLFSPNSSNNSGG